MTEKEPAPQAVARVRKNDLAVVLSIDAAASELLGWSAEEMVGVRSFEFIHPDDQELAVENWMQMLSSLGSAQKVRLRHKRRDGNWVLVEMTNYNRLDDPEDSCVVAEMVDISGQVTPEEFLAARDESPYPYRQLPLRLDQALRSREQLMRRLSEALPLGVLQCDAQGRIVYTNRMLHTILGMPRAATVSEQLPTVRSGDRPMVREVFEAVLRDGLDNDIELQLEKPDEQGGTETRQCTMSLRALTNDRGEVTGAIACMADVTDSVRMREELRIRATFDEVTQCYNRAATMEALEATLARSDEGSRPAVIFIDLDRFKEVNDRFGHAAGDAMLEIVARRLLRAVRRKDLVGRIGGDEFLVVCPGISTAAQAMRAATRVANTLRHHVRLKKTLVACRASIGVAWSPGPLTDADTLVRQADSAMYKAKRRKTEEPVFYKTSPVGVGNHHSNGAH
jgi:diguanylate cyclase (GGDEF)-like protein/PAS domain S-box-containing protein